MEILFQVYSGKGAIRIAIIAGVVIVLIIGIMVPLLIKNARRASKSAKNFVPDLISMSGLQPNENNEFIGKYKNFDTALKMGMGVNYAEAGLEMMRGFAGGGMNFHQRNMFFQKFTIIMKTDKQLPELALKQKVGVLRTDQYIMDKFNNKNIELPEIKDLKFKKVRVFSNNRDAASRVINDGELQNLLLTWHFTDVRVFDNNVVFTLDDNMVNPTFGGRRLSTPHFIIQALDITARVMQLVV